jgi:hypothetical protein
LRCPGPRAGNRARHLVTDAVEATELSSLTTNAIQVLLAVSVEEIRHWFKDYIWAF